MPDPQKREQSPTWMWKKKEERGWWKVVEMGETIRITHVTQSPGFCGKCVCALQMVWRITIIIGAAIKRKEEHARDGVVFFLKKERTCSVCVVFVKWFKLLTVQSRQHQGQRPKGSTDCGRRNNPRQCRNHHLLFHLFRRHPTTSLTRTNPATRAPFIYYPVALLPVVKLFSFLFTDILFIRWW